MTGMKKRWGRTHGRKSILLFLPYYLKNKQNDDDVDYVQYASNRVKTNRFPGRAESRIAITRARSRIHYFIDLVRYVQYL